MELYREDALQKISGAPNSGELSKTSLLTVTIVKLWEKRQVFCAARNSLSHSQKLSHPLKPLLLDGLLLTSPGASTYFQWN